MIKADDNNIDIDVLDTTLLSVKEVRKVPREMREAESSWWLRSPGFDAYEAAFVIGGYVHDIGDYVDKDFGVRPALKLDPKSLKIGDSFSYRGYEWDVIADDIALCRSIVGKCPFRRDYEADDANDYESSDIKKWLSDWWEKVRNDDIR